MAQPDDHEARIEALETHVRDLDERVRLTAHDAAAARVLAGGADRDVHEIRDELRDFRRATTATLNAMRDDMTDMRQHMDARFADMDRGFAEMRGKLDATAAGIQVITGLLTRQLDEPPASEQP